LGFVWLREQQETGQTQAKVAKGGLIIVVLWSFSSQVPSRLSALASTWRSGNCAPAGYKHNNQRDGDESEVKKLLSYALIVNLATETNHVTWHEQFGLGRG
jgi:hypothetical protein